MPRTDMNNKSLMKNKNFNVMRFIKYVLWVVLIPLAIGCADAWDDHTKKNPDVSDQTVWQYVQSNPDLSVFAGYIQTAHLESVFTDLQLKTAYIPSNTALSAIDAELVNNEAKLQKFVLNHVCLGQYKSVSTSGNYKLTMLNGKVLVMDADNQSLDGVAFNTDNEQQVLNGVVNILDAPVIPRINVWEYIETLAPVNKHTAYLKSLTGDIFVDSLSTQIGVNEEGKPVYDSVFVWNNQFCADVADLTSEDSTFTVFIVEDAVYDAEYNKFKSYYKVVNGTTARDSALVKSKIVKDYVFTTAYARNELPALLKSIYNVGVPFADGAVVSEFKGSNGYVYVLSQCDIALTEKIQPIIIQAEDPDSYYGLSTEKGAAYRYLRQRANSQGGYDVVLDNWNTSNALSDGLILHAGVIASMKYKCYWRAINDFNSSYRNPITVRIPDPVNKPTEVNPRWDISQKLGYCVAKTYNSDGTVKEFAPPSFIHTDFIVVPRTTGYAGTAENPTDETFVGETTFTTVNDIYLQLVPSIGGVGVTTDYIKLVPVFN
jgi:hypothetical protein